MDNQGTSADPIGALRDASFLVAADDSSKDALEAAAELKSFAARAPIFKQGDPADSVLFIRSGAVRIYVEQPDGNRIELRTLGAGEIFGELGVVGGTHRTANAQAATDVEVWSIDNDAFESVYRSDERVALAIARITAPYVLSDEESGDVTVAGLQERVVKSIMKISDSGAAVTAPELARMAEARVSNVIGILEQLIARDLIAVSNGGIEILDQEELDSLARS